MRPKALRAALDSPRWSVSGRVEDTSSARPAREGVAWREGVGTSVEGLMADAA